MGIVLVTYFPQCLLHQVRKLDAAIRKEEKEAASAAEICNADGVDGVVMDGKADGDNKRKRKRGGGAENEEENDVSLDAAKLESMGYRELQALAKARGFSANGSKKDVMQRLLSTPATSVAIVDCGLQDKKEAAGGLFVCSFSIIVIGG
jgi:poly [ADP-ribose] polymerase